MARSSQSWPLWIYLRRNLNFFRIHLLSFTFVPLILSVVLYASNGRFKITYIDSLLLCVGAMTMGGLAPVDISSLTPWQQMILFIEMCLGSPVLISWMIVFIRKYYFAKKFKQIVEASVSSRQPGAAIVGSHFTAQGWWERLSSVFVSTDMEQRAVTDLEKDLKSQDKPNGITIKRLRPDMIHRVDGAPKPVDPSGVVFEVRPPSLAKQGNAIARHDPHQDLERELPSVDPETLHSGDGSGDATGSSRPRKRRKDLRLVRRLSDPGMSVNASATMLDIPWSETAGTGIGSRTQMAEFAPVNIPRRRGRSAVRQNVDAIISPLEPRSTSRSSYIRQFTGSESSDSAGYRQTPTPSPARKEKLKNRGLGGFPMPLDILKRLMHHLFPNLERKLARTLTVQRTMSLVSGRADAHPGAKVVPYISFDATVGRNSSFHHLTSEQRDEIGGVEYRALRALLWIVGAYHIITQVICFVIISPYMSQPRWASNFVPPQQHRVVDPVWFSLFQVVTAYTNTGISLVDQSMIPFRTAFSMTLPLIFLVLAGNTAYPIFLRFMIWIITKCVPKQSRVNETLHFLLDHPRRCYTLLFPSHQTWFLLTFVLALTITDWVFFVLLDIGNASFSQLSVWLQVVNGLLQVVSIRSAGFTAVSLTSLAPAVKVMMVVTMYIGAYPIALSVRATNVYEERSLGIFNDEGIDVENFNAVDSRISIWSKYLTLHARKQLAFDMWWLSLALFLICIIEKGKLMNPDNASWFNLFNIIFEIVSAYGTVGLSTGVPHANYALSSAFHPLSKLIICVVMLRGRHRDLPVAIDRAVLLPGEYNNHGDGENDGIDDSNNGRPILEVHNGQPTRARMDSYSSIVEKSIEDITEIRRKSCSKL